MQPKSGGVQEPSGGTPPLRPGGLSLPRPPGDAGPPRAREPIAPPPVDGVALPTPPADGAPATAAPPPSAAQPALQAKPARSLRVADLVTASLLLALGVVVLFDAVRMGIGWGSDGPESGFVPFWLAIVLVASCVDILVRALRSRPDRRFASVAQLARVLTVLVPATAMILLVPWLGLYVSSALYMGGYMRWEGRHGWAVSILLPLAFVALIFLVFERWFLVPLPKGPLESWLGY